MRALALLLALLALPVAADPDGVTAEGRTLALTARATPMGPMALGPGVAFLGAWVLTSRDPDFGGISGLLVEGDRMTAVTDRGHWLTARIDLAAPGLVSDARIAPMRAADGRLLSGKTETDAEGLARVGGRLFVAFEQDHRVLAHEGGGRLGPAFALRGADRLVGRNAGAEGLATLPDGRVIAIAEGRDRDAFPYWVLGGARGLRGVLPATGIHDVTGADLGSDGRLYVVLRHFSRATGVSIRVRRYLLSEGGTPVSGSGVEIAGFEALSGIDNMEAIALAPGAEGQVLWLLADDNFNPPQRTLLVALGVPG